MKVSCERHRVRRFAATARLVVCSVVAAAVVVASAVVASASDPVGTFTEYAIPTAGSGAFLGIAAGPDGNMWFTEDQANKVAKVTPSGTFTEYTVPVTAPVSNSFPSRIAAGPDGNMWVTSAITNKVFKVTTSGTFTEYTLPDTSNNTGALGIGERVRFPGTPPEQVRP